MLKRALLPTLGILAIVTFVIYGYVSGLFDSRLEAPKAPAFVNQVPDNWERAQSQRRVAIAQHLSKNKEHYDHFAYFPVSKTQGIPLIILKLLPKLAPEFWGDERNFLSVMGLFYDERNQGAPFPLGIGFTGLVRDDLSADIDYASFTCGGCHIGRLRKEDGSYEYLDGGVNSEFNVVGYRHRIIQTLNKVYGSETNRDKKNQLVVSALLKAVDELKDSSYFYNNYRYGDRHFDTEYEAQQIELFKQGASNFVAKFIEHQESVYEGWLVIAEKFYPDIKERIGVGFAGMEDAIGFNAASAYQNLKSKPLTSLFAGLALPQSHGITDIMVVWDQDSHDPRWNEDKTRLIDGGGQWNGHIPLPIYKNLAAQVTLGFSEIDVSVSAHSEKLLQYLPPAIYPYEVDLELARKGQQLFAENCADCHQPNNGMVYTQMGTDMGRAKIAGTLITVAAQKGFTSDADCSTTTTVVMGGKEVKPCAEYRGVSLEGQSKQAMLPPRVHNGYNALPLSGLWAQAPYLHNGSVPTLYHMLVPNERPATFIKSRLDFDAKHVGFKWQQDDWDKKEGYLYDTSSSPAISNAGHDTDIKLDGKTYRLDWSDNKQDAWALIEYLKTL